MLVHDEIKQTEEVAPTSAPTSTPAKAPRREQRPVEKRSRLKWYLSLALILLVCVGGISLFAASSWSQPNLDFVLHEATRGDLKIAVTERGTLESQENVKILCEVDDIRGDGINGTPIVWLIENGASVKKGDLLIEFAGSSVQQELDEQILETEQARSEAISARAKHKNQITQNETAEADAELAVKLADLELKMFSDKDNGTHKLEVEEINRLIDDINNEILAAQANLELKRNEMEGIQSLFKLGYAGKSEVDRTRLDYLQAESQYAAKINKLQTQLATLVKKNTYEKQMQLLTLQGVMDTAERALVQVKLDNESLLEQALGTKQAAEESLKKEEERLKRWKEQVENCKVYAPQDGMVVYASGGKRFWEEDIRVGAAVNPRQHVLSLPNLSKMQVRLAVHESVLNQIEEGTPATIRVEAFPDRRYSGKVDSVAVLASSQGNAAKVYDTVVTIDGELNGIRPGMTAIAEIHIEHLKDVIGIPVQSIVQVEKNSWCYVIENGQVERRDLELGVTNDKLVEIQSGVEVGDQVILNPMSIVENSEENEHESSTTDESAEAEAETFTNEPTDSEASSDPADSEASSESADSADSVDSEVSSESADTSAQPATEVQASPSDVDVEEKAPSEG